MRNLRNQAYLDSDVYLDMDRFFLSKNGLIIHFSPTQFLILKSLFNASGHPVSAETIIYSIWGKNENIKINDLHVYVNRIRRKMEENPRKPKYLLTVRGYGYLLNTEHRTKSNSSQKLYT